MRAASKTLRAARGAASRLRKDQKRRISKLKTLNKQLSTLIKQQAIDVKNTKNRILRHGETVRALDIIIGDL